MLKSRLCGLAEKYKTFLDRTALCDPDTGVTYFKDEMRQHFIKGTEHTFLWRFLTFMQKGYRRGTTELIEWIVRFETTLRKLREAWMDLMPLKRPDDPYYLADVAAHNQTAGIQNQADPQDPAVFEAWRQRETRRHAMLFPVTDRMVTLLFIVNANLSEEQREKLVSSLSVRGFHIDNYDYETVKQTMREIFINTRTPIDDPNLRRDGAPRSFYVMDNGEYDGEEGFWVQDDETGEEGFVSLEEEGIFWVQGENEETFLLRRVPGRKFRMRGGSRFPRKGKGKGKGRSRGKFRSYRRKGYGKGKGYAVGDSGYEDESMFGKGKKGRKGKGKGKDQGKGFNKGTNLALQKASCHQHMTMEKD
jgi:hypothetical protein